MKKAITTILSVLMLISCLTVNVFAQNEGQSEDEEQAITEIDSAVVDHQTEEYNADEDSAVSLFSETKNASAIISVDDMKNEMVQYDGVHWFINFDDNNAPDIYQAIAFKNNHFVVNYNGTELHGNCNDETHVNSKLVPAIEDDMYVYKNSEGNGVFSLFIDPGINTSLDKVSASVNVNDIDYGFERVDDKNLFVFTVGNNPVPSEDSFSKVDSIKISIPNSDPLICNLNGGGHYEDYLVEFYTIVWFETSDGFEHACYAINAIKNPGGDNPGDVETDELYARQVTEWQNETPIFKNYAETSTNGDIYVDIFKNQEFGLFYGRDFNNSTSSSEERISSFTITEKEGMTISQSDGLLNVYSERSDSFATITYEGKSLTFRSKLPDVGIYTSDVISDMTYCAEYNDSRRDFYINWDNERINSVAINRVKGYDLRTHYDISQNGKSINLAFYDNVDIRQGDLIIEISVMYEDTNQCIRLLAWYGK